MATTHTLRVPQAARTSSGAVADASATTTTASDRLLWLQVGIATALGAGAAVLATAVIFATQTLQMHF